MPEYIPHSGSAPWALMAVVGVLVCLATYAIWHAPLLLLLGAGIGIWGYFDTRRIKRKFEALSEVRSEESICEFARSFERNSIDTWVIRAVYEQVQKYVVFSDKALPLKEDDDLFELLELDEDDVDMDLAVEIAQRTGRSLDNAENNPYFGKVKTVGDLVRFFNAQPLAKST